MKRYAGIDLHGTNSVIGVLDEADRVLYRQRLRNELPGILAAFAPFRETLQGIAVESTYHWYWLVDGLMDAGYVVHLAHVPALPQYSGLKHADDHDDAQWLAHLLRLGLLPTGHIDPKADRPLRDLLRKRGQWVRHKTMVVLSLQSLLTRLTGRHLPLPRLRELTSDSVPALVAFPEQVQSILSSVTVLRCLEQQIADVEHAVRAQGRHAPGYTLSQTVTGIGPILTLTILLEAGDIQRFATVGQFASYRRCVSSQYLSNGKRKGAGNTKNGNKYLSWAFVEAAHFAIRYDPLITGCPSSRRIRGVRESWAGVRSPQRGLAVSPSFLIGLALATQTPSLPARGLSRLGHEPREGWSHQAATRSVLCANAMDGVGFSGAQHCARGRRTLGWMVLPALILMGDGCDSVSWVDTTSNENGDASQAPHLVRSLIRTQRRPRLQHRGVREESCFPLTGAFEMGDPFISNRPTTQNLRVSSPELVCLIFASAEDPHNFSIPAIPKEKDYPQLLPRPSLDLSFYNSMPILPKETILWTVGENRNDHYQAGS